MTPLLVARGLAKSFGTRVAVSDLSLELRPGETFALVGPNGAGKTTTLRMLAGLIAPSQGHVELNGRALSPESAGWARRQVGILTEAPGLWDRLSVRQNLTVYARLYGLASPVAAVDAALERFGVLDRAKDASRSAVQGIAAARRAGAGADSRSAGRAAGRAHVGPRPRERTRRARAGARPASGRTRRAASARTTSTRWIAWRRAWRCCARRLLAVDTPEALRARFFEARVRVRLAGDPVPHAGVAARRGRRRRARGERRAVGGARRQPGSHPRPSWCGCSWRPARR